MSTAGEPRVHPAAIGLALATELNSYRGRWVAIIGQQVAASGSTAEEAVAGVDPDADALIFRVPSRALAAFLGIGQS